ncbi:MAG: hypothetical protein AB7T49_18950 [Oligoflexales bacterium]
MTKVKTLLASSLLVFACGKLNKPTSEFKFDSAHSIALDGTISSGNIISTNTDHDVIKEEIIAQLYYSIGYLNGYNAGPDMNRVQVSINDVQPREDGLYDVTYAAKMFIAWPRLTYIPNFIYMTVPERGDQDGLSQFFEAYGQDAWGVCMSAGAHDVSLGNFWYFYRPLNFTCPLVGLTSEYATRFNIDLSISDENTEDKYPEYSKVWEDGALVVTAIFGKNEFGSTNNSDAGINAFRETYFELISKYGTPVESNLAANQTPSATNDSVKLKFDTANGTLDVHLYVVDEIKSVSNEFIANYNERTKNSDFVSYSGHSGLGANIRALARMGSFVKGQYQIFLVNGCDTFAYVDNALRDAHQAANADAGPDKYFDIMTNAMPSYFHMNPRSNLVMIDGLMQQEGTYRDIMYDFDRSQRVNVTGEQDNKWPQAF